MFRIYSGPSVPLGQGFIKQLSGNGVVVDGVVVLVVEQVVVVLVVVEVVVDVVVEVDVGVGFQGQFQTHWPSSSLKKRPSGHSLKIIKSLYLCGMAKLRQQKHIQNK